ncbi:CDP-alcohol phosphatidyltransferase family protein [Thiorhodococcus mannitoliphagus]|uniref:CDP-alcohol phosphatidyltransferase family protein n=1 Tax=Thiorhodococcus mannitoliphagus TaxID=329406 RepID=A0A6P1DUL9_9GAMM|nr:CDP-alcohol phosphatidyltransferase family protein [Thiorhodococcus mannitoliphagus]NEX22027.1 CDP-alcohol phosphatidyltransferase family protein [Thiorhodococcus mannitoliphagus]
MHPRPARQQPPMPRPGASLLRSGILNATTGMLLLAVGGDAINTHLALSGWATVRSLCLFAVALTWLHGHLVLHRPHQRIHAANQVTLVRLGLTTLIAGWVGEPMDANPWLPPLVAGLILALDGLDGWLARRGGWASAFGARFDMETDALLVLTLAALLWSQDKAGGWILIAGLARYLFVLAARRWSWLDQPLPPSRRRQTLCVLIVLTLLLSLIPPIQPPLSLSLAALAVTFTLYTFGVDLRWLWRQQPETTAGQRMGVDP